MCCMVLYLRHIFASTINRFNILNNNVMKKQHTPTTILSSFVFFASLTILLIFSFQYSFSKDYTVVKTVFYKGEWIMRVDLPEVNISSTLITKGGITPLLKQVSFSSPGANGELTILTEDINITAHRTSEIMSETVTMNVTKSESTLIKASDLIEGEKSLKIQSLVSKKESSDQPLSSIIVTAYIPATNVLISSSVEPLLQSKE